MTRRCLRGASLWAVAVLLAATPISAQDSDPPPPPAAPPSVEELQRQVQELSAQLQTVQRQLEQLQALQDAQQREAELEHIRQAAAAEAARDAAPEEVDPATRFTSGTRMQPQLNPELSVTGDIFLLGGDHLKTEMQARHFELDLQAYLDPYTRMHVVFGYEGAHSVWGWEDEGHDHEELAGDGDEDGHAHEEEGGFALEEGYISWLQMPGNTSLTIGRKRQQFGTLNRWHMHALPQTDYPWVIQESFGGHGLAATGVSVEWQMPKLWADSNELVIEVMNGDNETAFAGADWKRPSALFFFKNYWDLSPNTYFELDLSGLRGATDHDGDLKHDFLALDLVYDWYPAGRELYRGFQLRGMLLRSWLELADGGSLDTWGSYLYGQLKVARGWVAGVRWDRVEDQQVAGEEYWGLSPYLTFWQSEFVRLRGQYSYRNHNLYGADHRFELQFTFAAGPHKHEEY